MKLAKFYAKYFLFRSTQKVENIERVIRSHGFEIHEFDPFETDSSLLRLCGCAEFAKTHPCFIFIKENIKDIFIQESLSDDDRIEYLFHEEAHIWYNHTNITGFTENTNAQQEKVANHFLFKLRILKTITVLLTIAILTAGVFFLASRPSETVAGPDPVVDATSQAEEPPAQIVDTVTVFPEDPVWITAEGDAYHREYCGTIAGSNTRTQTTRRAAEQLGRHPCAHCNP